MSTKTKEFMKFDTGKVMVSLVDPDFIMGVGQILKFGAKKYDPIAFSCGFWEWADNEISELDSEIEDLEQEIKDLEEEEKGVYNG